MKTKEQFDAMVDNFNSNATYVSKIMRNSNGYRVAFAAWSNPGVKQHPDRSGKRFVTNYTNDACVVLKKLGIEYVWGNNAPRGGAIGNYVMVK